MATTRLTLSATPGRPYAAFIAKLRNIAKVTVALVESYSVDVVLVENYSVDIVLVEEYNVTVEEI